jgi:hypothetical protein
MWFFGILCSPHTAGYPKRHQLLRCPLAPFSQVYRSTGLLYRSPDHDGISPVERSEPGDIGLDGLTFAGTGSILQLHIPQCPTIQKNFLKEIG